MKWFEGDIPRAIQQTKINKSVFIVFVSGEDDKSNEMESFLHKEDVTGLVEANRCVAIKLLADSNDCKFFSQIYPVVVIPSTFFIADTGVPIEVIGECRSHEDFLAKVKNAVEKKDSDSVGAAAQVLPSLPTQNQQQSTPPVPAAAESIQAQDKDDDLVGAVAATENDADDAAEVPPPTEPSLEEKVEKAKQLVELKRDEKLRQEAEDARRREVERRNIGQNVQKLRQHQKEADLLEAKMELKRGRDEDKIARQKVKDDIERDRLEKAERYSKEKDEKTKIADDARKKKLLEQQAAQVEEQARRSDNARIQFRLPDGSSVTHQFPSTDPFANVHQFITQHTGTAVNLSMTFPRRTFTLEDHSLTLQELQLAPSAAIMVIPGGVSTSVVRSSSGLFSFSGITGLLFAPVVFVWNIIGSIIGYTGLTPSVSATAKIRSSPTSSARGGSRDPGSAYKRATTSSTTQDGSIRKFRNAEDDDSEDDRTTWNGNSTQQM
uniref:UBX domain-containing protein 4 n=1 Tax=Arion vulgaris TaxID=1028688 RepID=A0A0B6YAD3_9EUPU